MFSKSFEIALKESFEQAREHRHEFITVEHLLKSLLDNPEACIALTSCGANIDRLQSGLAIFIEETTPLIPKGVERQLTPTLSFQRVLQRAINEAQNSGVEEVNGVHVLLSILHENDSEAVYFLNQENVTLIDLMEYSNQGISRRFMAQETEFPSEFMSPPMESDFSNGEGGAEAGAENLIEQFTTNLNERALTGKIDPLVGRQDELMRCVQVLCRRSKNNPLLVGEAGVGKTAIAEGLAQMIVEGRAPKTLADTTVYTLDLGVLVAGTKYRGDFEKRFKTVLNALSKHTGAIIFIDEIHNIVGAGSATGGTMDAANLIKPLLSSGELRCMGATTYDEYRNFITKDNALLRRFQKVDVIEPDEAQTLEIVKGLQERFEAFHGVHYSDEALERAVALTTRFLPERHQPDKAVDTIDEAGAFQSMQPEKTRKKIITAKEIEEVVASIARIPVKTLSASDRQMLRHLPRKLKSVVFGQDDAINSLTDAIKLSRSGLRDKNKPVGSFLMIGPTGVGKTEVTRQLADALGVELIRFDMSEYMEKHAVSRLIGAPPGYVGYDQGGLLTEALIKKPNAVLLLDEIEKAHPDMFNLLLQAMDYGQLTDNNGRKADLRHVIIIMTSNVGADMLERETMGFTEQDRGEDSLAAARQLFTPEFRNRLDAIVQFHALKPEVMMQIVDKDLQSLRDQLGEKDVNLKVAANAKHWLAENGYDKKLGARPLMRLIQERIRKPLAEELLFGDLNNQAGSVNISLQGNALKIQPHVKRVKARNDANIEALKVVEGDEK